MQPAEYATIILAVLGPFLGYQFSLRQEQRRWSRERRDQAYLKLLELTEGLRQEWTKPPVQTGMLREARWLQLDLPETVLAYASRQVLNRTESLEIATRGLYGAQRGDARVSAYLRADAALRARIRHELIGDSRVVAWIRSRRPIEIEPD